MEVIILDHPLCHHKLTLLRDIQTPMSLFRKVVEELGFLLAVESTKNLLTEAVTVQTPLELAHGKRLASLDPVFIPILRAGLGLLHPFLQLIPTAKVGHLGLYRDAASLAPVAYYRNFPALLEKRFTFIIDPMLATGGSASEAVKQLKDAGAKNITFSSILAAPEGIRRLQAEHPDVRIVVAAIDRQLNDKAYIMPGLGDAGDRLFGTHNISS